MHFRAAIKCTLGSQMQLLWAYDVQPAISWLSNLEAQQASAMEPLGKPRRRRQQRQSRRQEGRQEGETEAGRSAGRQKEKARPGSQNVEMTKSVNKRHINNACVGLGWRRLNTFLAAIKCTFRGD